MRRNIIVVVVVLAIALGTLLLAGEIVKERNEAQAERYSYIGTVTAVVHGNSYDTVWLNSQPQSIRIWGGEVELAVGAEYEIVLDGAGNLVNAKILED